MEWSKELLRVLNRIGDKLGRIRRVLKSKERVSKEERYGGKDWKDGGRGGEKK